MKRPTARQRWLAEQLQALDLRTVPPEESWLWNALRLIYTAAYLPHFEPVLPKRERPRCGAKCRDGHACQAPVYRRGPGVLSTRCRMHGGKGTGPKTEEGKRRALEALARGRLNRLEKLRQQKASTAPTTGI